MAEFQGLATFKNVFLAPLTRALEESTPIPVPATNATSIVSRHDHHNIEIKTVSELGPSASSVETDIYLFIPRSFEIDAVGKAELLKDFRSRMRLALPVHGDLSVAALASGMKSIRAKLNKLEESERRGEHLYDFHHPLAEELLESTKDLCTVIAETLKHGASEHARQFFLSHTLLTTTGACTTGLETLALQVRGMHDMIERVRLTCATDCQAAQTVLSIFDEYISQLYVQYLGSIRTEFARIGKPRAGIDVVEYESARIQLESLLNRLQEKEAQHRRRFGTPLPDEESDIDRERRLVRLSHLKKFFQSKMFIEISRQQAAKKVSESTAAAGTALAGIVAALIERFSRPEVVDVAFQGLFVLSFGVIVYVLRDRLKDWAKAHFHAKALKFIPDFQQQLIARDKKIGVVKEWFRITENDKVPGDLLQLRKNASDNEMENRLPEDIFYCRKIQTVLTSRLEASGHMPHSRALHEYTRINFERYLKHMDDPFKDFTDLDPDGNFLQSRSRRVYHFYLCVKTTSRSLEKRRWLPMKKAVQRPHHEETLVYRIVLDKNGVVRIEDRKDSGTML